MLALGNSCHAPMSLVALAYVGPTRDTLQSKTDSRIAITLYRIAGRGNPTLARRLVLKKKSYIVCAVEKKNGTPSCVWRRAESTPTSEVLRDLTDPWTHVGDTTVLPCACVMGFPVLSMSDTAARCVNLIEREMSRIWVTKDNVETSAAAFQN